MDPLEQGNILMEMIRNSQRDRTPDSPPLTTVCLVEAHVEIAKLFFSLSRHEEPQRFSSSVLLQMALDVLLMILPIVP